MVRVRVRVAFNTISIENIGKKDLFDNEFIIENIGKMDLFDNEFIIENI